MPLAYPASRFSPCKLTEAPTVFVIDSDSSVREALDQLIRSAGWQSRTAASVEEFLTGPRIIGPSCLLSEMNLPGMTGLDLQKLVLDRRELPIIFISHLTDVHTAVQAMKSGAFELLTKPLTADLVLSAIRGAFERSRAALSYLSRIESLRARYQSLSVREREVLGLVVSGRLNKQVGGDLGITEYTVKVHRGRAMRKMQADSFAELISMVASLRGESIATGPRFHASPEATTHIGTWAQSTRQSDFDLVPA
jgi:FixJ family two-component response regulator